MDDLTRVIEDERAVWLARRSLGIGASEIAKLCGLSRYGSPWTVWADKVGLTPRDQSYSERQQIGLDLEPALGKMFNRRTGLYIAGAQTWCRDIDAPWRLCTVDGFAYEHMPGIDDGDEPDESGRFFGALGTVQHKTDGRYTWPDGVPPDIRAQCIWEMGVTHLEHAWLSVLHGGFRYEVYEIPFDPDDWAYMTDVADRFWHDHVVTGQAPPIDGSDATTAALKAAYPEEEPGKRTDVADWDIEMWHELTAAARRMEAEAREARNRIIAEMGDAEIGTVNGLARVTYRQQPGRSHTCTSCGHIDRGDPFRVLRDAPKKLADLPAIEQAP